MRWPGSAKPFQTFSQSLAQQLSIHKPSRMKWAQLAVAVESMQTCCPRPTFFILQKHIFCTLHIWYAWKGNVLDVSWNCILCQNSVGWWSFSMVSALCHINFFHLTLSICLSLSLGPPVAFHSFTLELSSLISVFLITHNNKLSVTLSWQKSLLWIAKMNRMKNDGPFAGLEEQSVGHHEGDWKEWKEITFGYTIIYLYHFMFIPFSSTAFFAVPVQQMAAFSIHTDPNWQWHLKSMRMKSVPCWNAILSHAMYSEQYNQEKFSVSPFAEAGKKWIWLQKTFRLAEQAIIARNIQTNKVNRIQFVSDTKIRKSC